MVGVLTYPGHAYCRDEWIKNTLEVTKGHDVYLLWNGSGNPKKIFPKNWTIDTMNRDGLSGIRILEKGHQKIRRYFLARKYTHLFMLESDTFPPPGTIDKFLTHDKDALSCLYFIKAEGKMHYKVPLNNLRLDKQFRGKNIVLVKRDIIPSVWGLVNNPKIDNYLRISGIDPDEAVSAQTESRLWRITDALPQRGLVRVLASGVGSVLIKREVLEMIDFRVQDGDIQQFTDFMLYWDMYNAGFKTFVDTDTWANHIHPFDEIQSREKWFDAKTAHGSNVRPESHKFK